jgi:hypothetical protein
MIGAASIVLIWTFLCRILEYFEFFTNVFKILDIQYCTL